MDKEMMKIICISNVMWDAKMWTNSQEVMSRISQHYKVLFVEDQHSIFSPLKRPPDLKLMFSPLRKKHENLFVYYPAPGLPFSHKIYWINYINKFIQAFFLKQIIKKLKFENAVLWVYSPKGSLLMGNLGEKLTCYDCIDEYSEYEGVNKQIYKRLENKILVKADLVFATSRILFEEKRKYNSNTFYTPNPADASLFLKANNRHLPIPDDIRSISTPIIGFFGELNYKIDLKLIEYMAQSHPEWSIVLIGPIVKIDMSTLRHNKNIYILGWRQKIDLPGYLKAFRVCIIPYLLTEYTKRIAPLKFYEYFASGKPVVTVDIPECREFGNLLMVAKSNEEFVAQVERVLNEKDEEIVIKRIELAKQNTWEKKVARMLQLIEGRMAGGEVHG